MRNETPSPPPFQGGAGGGENAVRLWHPTHPPLEKGRSNSSLLEQSIFDTVRFFDLCDMPVTATQIWQQLVVAKSGYDHHASLQEIQRILSESTWLQDQIGKKWGYVFLKNKEHLVRERLARHAIAQDKWKILLRCARFLAFVPFVKGLAGSGSLAQDNTKPTSDLDIFVITQEGRIWTARLLLLCVSQLLGRRRKYDEQSAPDMLCLNHYVTEKSLQVSSDIQNVCIAMLYAHLVPVYNASLFHAFLRRNASWMSWNVELPFRPDARHKYTITLNGFLEGVKHQVELLLLEPIGDFIERYAELLQRYVIERHGGLSQKGRIVLSYHELAFHPDTKVPATVLAFYGE